MSQLEALEQAQEGQPGLLQAVLEAMADGVVVVSAEGSALLANAAARRIFAGSSLEAAPTLDLFADHDFFLEDLKDAIPLAQTPVGKVLGGMAMVQEAFYLRRRSTGETFGLKVSGRPIENRCGAPRSAVLVFRDITESEPAESQPARLTALAQSGSEALSGPEIGSSAVVRDLTENRRCAYELAERTRELERSNNELEQFAHSASHDLQEPLRMIGSYLQLLHDRYRGRLDADADDFIDFAMDGALRMKQLIDDLLRYSRVGHGHLSAAIESDVALDWAVANLALKIRESGAVVIRGEMPRVMADASQLGQLLQNLIDNALKFRSAAAPQIEIGAERHDDRWEFHLRDNGIGIGKQHASRIFQMFQRLHSHAEYPGTGIGLAVCRKIVECNGGRIWIDQEARQGSDFRFTLPAATAVPALIAAPRSERA